MRKMPGHHLGSHLRGSWACCACCEQQMRRRRCSSWALRPLLTGCLVLLASLSLWPPELTLTPEPVAVDISKSAQVEHEVRSALRQGGLHPSSASGIHSMLRPILCRHDASPPPHSQSSPRSSRSRSCAWVRRAVLVVGLESSGTKLAAAIVARALLWPHSQWDSLDPAATDRDTGRTTTTSTSSSSWHGGHGGAFDSSSGTLVLHRSLPHGVERPYFSDVRAIAEVLRREYAPPPSVPSPSSSPSNDRARRYWRHQPEPSRVRGHAGERRGDAVDIRLVVVTRDAT